MDGETISAVSALILAEKAVTAGWRAWRGKRRSDADDRVAEATATKAEADVGSTSGVHAIEAARSVVELMAGHVKRADARERACDERAREYEERCIERTDKIEQRAEARDDECRKRIDALEARIR